MIQFIAFPENSKIFRCAQSLGRGIICNLPLKIYRRLYEYPLTGKFLCVIYRKYFTVTYGSNMTKTVACEHKKLILFLQVADARYYKYLQMFLCGKNIMDCTVEDIEYYVFHFSGDKPEYLCSEKHERFWNTVFSLREIASIMRINKCDYNETIAKFLCRFDPISLLELGSRSKLN